LSPFYKVNLGNISVILNVVKFLPKFMLAGKLLKYIAIFVWYIHLSVIMSYNFDLSMPKKLVLLL